MKLKLPRDLIIAENFQILNFDNYFASDAGKTQVKFALNAAF